MKKISSEESVAIRLEALMALVAPYIRSKTMNKMEAKAAEDKAIALLVSEAGLSQGRVAKILGVDNNRVNEVVRRVKF